MVRESMVVLAAVLAAQIGCGKAVSNAGSNKAHESAGTEGFFCAGDGNNDTTDDSGSCKSQGQCQSDPTAGKFRCVYPSGPNAPSGEATIAMLHLVGVWKYACKHTGEPDPQTFQRALKWTMTSGGGALSWAGDFTLTQVGTVTDGDIASITFDDGNTSIQADETQGNPMPIVSGSARGDFANVDSVELANLKDDQELSTACEEGDTLTDGRKADLYFYAP